VVGDCDIYQISEICVQPLKKAKRVAFIHDLTTILYPHHHVKSNVMLHNKRFKDIHKIDAILTNSEYTKKDIIEHLNIKPEKVFVTYLGADGKFKPIDILQVNSVLDKYRIQKPYILFVGTLEPRKNVQNIIKAFNHLKQTKKIPHKLVLAGQKGWKFEDIFKEIGTSQFKSDIIHIGYADDGDIPALMSGAEVFLYPSLYEGFGLPVLEAMKCGVPVITSNISSMPEVGGDACLYVEPESVQQLADKLYLLINNKDLQNNFSKKGMERAKLFSWEKCAEETLRVYKTIYSH
jgi:glycosyltransferase involved in cell wall biosynthesis